MLRPAIDAWPLLPIHDFEAKFRCDDDLIAFSGEGLADEDLVLEWAIDFGRVKESHAEFKSTVNGRNRFVFVAHAIGKAHPHAAKPKRRNLQALAAQFPLFHRALL